MGGIAALLAFKNKGHTFRSKGQKLWDNFRFNIDSYQPPNDKHVYSRSRNFIKWYKACFENMLSGGNEKGKLFKAENKEEDSMIKKKLIDFQIDLNRK